MTVDRSKLIFYSADPIDKIVLGDSFTESVAGASSGSTTTVLVTKTNTYGAKGFLTVSWSLDGTNFYDQSSQITTSTGFTVDGVIGGCDDDSLYFQLMNSETTAQTFTVEYVLDTIS